MIVRFLGVIICKTVFSFQFAALSQGRGGWVECVRAALRGAWGLGARGPRGFTLGYSRSLPPGGTGAVCGNRRIGVPRRPPIPCPQKRGTESTSVWNGRVIENGATRRSWCPLDSWSLFFEVGMVSVVPQLAAEELSFIDSRKSNVVAPSLTGLRGKNGDRHPTLKGGASLHCAYGAGAGKLQLP